ncbi:ABC transporter permease [Bradyrhizobium yuanmingense]|uniref:ABC transporter permease n=1 Tax=Bradyrhizobium yuanmingense TaxID=108015 RepID=UPI0023B94989|nr:ABC transporter permease [Bradyrhizobium yuanmingense]MDF0498949.1 ABC transporter permease [Bradyrhizobium yuanmingense]
MTERRCGESGTGAEVIVLESQTIDPGARAGRQVSEGAPHNQWWDVWHHFKVHKGALVGAAIFLLIFVSVVCGPYVWRVSPTYIDVSAINSGFSWAHPFGIDELGRDLLARIMTGGRISIAVGLTAMFVSLVLGSLVGILAGYFKALDGPLMRLTELFLGLPVLPLLLVMMMLFRETLAHIFGLNLGIFVLIVSAIGLTSWMSTARVVRGEVLAIKQREFVLASSTFGSPPHRIILRHVLPNVLSPIMVSATLGIATAIITESTLSFLGLGFPPDFPTWGRLLFDGVEHLQDDPRLALAPGIAIALTVLGVNYVGDGLRDALDPQLRR